MEDCFHDSTRWFGHLPDSATGEGAEPQGCVLCSHLFGRDACGIPESSPYLPWQVTLLLGELKMGPSPQPGSLHRTWSVTIPERNRRHAWMWFWVTYLWTVVPVTYPSSCMWLMGQLAGLPGANLGWEAGPPSMGSFIQAALQHSCLKVPGE